MIELHNMDQLEGTWINYLDSVLKKYSTVLTINSNVAQIRNLRWEFSVKSILDKLKDCLWSKDFDWVSNHEKYSVYLNIIPNKYCAASHLKLNISSVKKRLISKCRINSSFVRINSLNVIMKDNCIVCGNELDNPHHILFQCSAHSASNQYVSDLHLLDIRSEEKAKVVVHFIHSCFNRRDLAY